MNAQKVTDTAVDLDGITPFATGFNCVVANTSAGSLTLQGSDDDSTYTDLATVPAGAFVNVASLPRYVKVSTAASLYLLA